MFNKKLFVIAIFFVSLIAISTVSASENATEKITTTEIDSSSDVILSNSIDDESLTDTDNRTFRELQDKIDAADEGDTVHLENDYVNDGNFSSDGINITKAITIEGNGFIINAAGNSRIFNIDATKNVILNNISFNGGNASYGGAIIFNNDIEVHSFII